jgi:hypothetical protein
MTDFTKDGDTTQLGRVADAIAWWFNFGNRDDFVEAAEAAIAAMARTENDDDA